MFFMDKLDANYICTRLLCPHCHILRWKIFFLPLWLVKMIYLC
jgi:hypothetical protein